MEGSKVEEAEKLIRKLLKKILAINDGLGQERLSSFGHILMVKMRAFIQRLNVECQKEINTESLYDFWSENLEE